MGKFGKSLWKLFGIADSAHSIWVYAGLAWPFLVSAFTLLAGYAQRIPIMYIWVAAIFSFAMAAFGLSTFSQWRSTQSPEHKFKFERIDMGMADADASSTTIDALQPALVFINIANFPIEYEIENVEWDIAGRVPLRNDQPINMGAVTPPITTAVYRLNTSAVNGVDFSTQQRGRITCRVRYGITGKLKYTSNFAFEFTYQKTPATETRPLKYDYQWYYAPLRQR